MNGVLASGARHLCGACAGSAAHASSDAAPARLLTHHRMFVLCCARAVLCCAVLCREVLCDAGENPMVRHEAAEALGAIAAPECIALLRQVCVGGLVEVRGLVLRLQMRLCVQFAPVLRRSPPSPLRRIHLPLPSLCVPPPQYASDPEPIVADSCVVALDMLEFETSGGFQYADDGSSVQQEAAVAAEVAAAAALQGA